MAVVALLAAPVAAQDEASSTISSTPSSTPALEGWWLGFDTGWAQVDTDGGPGGRADDGWAMAFRGGRVLDERWLLGIELGGVVFEAGNLWDPSEGRALSDLLLVGELHPAREGGPYLHVAAGWVSYDDHDAAGWDDEGYGWGARLGVGYDWKIGRRAYLALLACWETGRVDADGGDDWSYDALRLSLGCTLR